ncbi:MAG TPA: hydroxysqualene dehydroxylase HpnE [Pseudolabrys sp.]|nr:hydroxysqualene dehydroxylase HpnE [Pseudolabrys sp.]
MHSSEAGSVHIIGGGLAGLAAAERLCQSRRTIVMHEATAQAGGRCRSYYDQSTGMVIDNGTHLLLSGNHAALSFTEAIGSRPGLRGPDEAQFPFIDIASGEQWTLRFGDSRFPWWVFDKDRRVPQTAVVDYLSLARLVWTSADKPIGKLMTCDGPIYDRLLEPLLLAALNITPREGSAKLAGAVIRESLALGGQACRPLLAREGLGSVFVEPAIVHLRERGVAIVFEDELIELLFGNGRVSRLKFARQTVDLGVNDAVILAVPPYVATNLVPDLIAPSSFRGIVNAHFRIDPPAHLPPMLGVINGTCEWIFPLSGRISATISDAGRLFDMPRTELAQTMWNDIAKVAGLPSTLPPWQIVRERRATFAATPEENARRPTAETSWENLFLAGDWTQTGLPATIEGAIRSGYRAADLVDHQLRAAA